mgnify:FL=1|tara:strand:- start:10026 stop:10703 length:678 start_codon:yes stop_codon:yes gene_type:complete
MAGGTLAIIGMAMSAVSAMGQMQASKQQAQAQQQMALQQSRLAGLRAQNEIRALEAQGKQLELTARLGEAQAALLDLEGRAETVKAKEIANDSMSKSLQLIASLDASSAARMVNLGNTPTTEALRVGLEDYYAGMSNTEIAALTGELRGDTQRLDASFRRSEAGMRFAEADYVRQVSPYEQSVIAWGGASQARITRQSGVASAFSSLGSAAFSASRAVGTGNLFD